MAFVDKKETVIQIELTPFGKRKIARGNFKPDHYMFFDDDIIYDNEYAGIADEVNKAQDRIDSVPRLDVQYLAKGNAVHVTGFPIFHNTYQTNRHALSLLLQAFSFVFIDLFPKNHSCCEFNYN